MKQQATFSVRSSHKFVDPSGKKSYSSNVLNTDASSKKSGPPQKGMAVRNSSGQPSVPVSSVIHGSQKGMAVRTSMNAMPDYS